LEFPMSQSVANQHQDLAVSPALSTYVAGALAADPPHEHRELARLHVLDTLAAIVACRDLEPAVLARAYALGLSRSDGPNA
ncbi:hypothetical protein, partial [Priestia megaterium]|uniref:hypothetical protein n=1 Tax=Priestia megaterium TaxID=1404 RepID=UPI0035B618BB